MNLSRRALLFIVAGVVLLLAACGREPDPRIGEVHRRAPGGDPETGRSLAAYWGCGACHYIPGVAGANSFVGPPLDAYSQRHYIAGTLVNNADNLVRWIHNPQAIEPGSAMPNLGMSEEEALHIAAYLYTLVP